MEKISENLEVSRLYVDKPIINTRSLYACSDEENREQVYTMKKGYKMRLVIETNFYATDESKDVATANARKIILQTIHARSLRHIAVLRQTICNGDEIAAMQLLDELQDTFGL